MASRLIYQGKVLDAKSAANEAGHCVPAHLIGQVQEIAINVVFSAGTSAGAVVVESSHDRDFTGTWANRDTVNWAAANRAHIVTIAGTHRALRVRISTEIAGGTVSVWVTAKN